MRYHVAVLAGYIVEVDVDAAAGDMEGARAKAIKLVREQRPNAESLETLACIEHGVTTTPADPEGAIAAACLAASGFEKGDCCDGD
jgi:hypothetical protein